LPLCAVTLAPNLATGAANRELATDVRLELANLGGGTAAVHGRCAMKTPIARALVDPADLPWVLLYSAVIVLLILVWAYVPA